MKKSTWIKNCANKMRELNNDLSEKEAQRKASIILDQLLDEDENFSHIDPEVEAYNAVL